MRTAIVLACFSAVLLCSWGADEPTKVTSNMATGMVPYTAFGGVRENINYSNGNLNLQIPLVSLPGRNGHDLNLALVYDSKMWTINGEFTNSWPSGTIDWFWSAEKNGWGVVGARGWRLNIPYLYSGTKYYIPAPGSCRTAFVVILPDGSKHSFANGGAINDPYTCPLSFADSQDGTYASLQTGSSEAVVYLKNGTRIYFPNNYGLASKVVDANGNVISYELQADGSLKIKDTLGREITVTISQSTGTATIVEYKNSDGTLKQILLSYSPLNETYLYAPSTETLHVSDFSQPQEYTEDNAVYPRVFVQYNPAGTSEQMLTTITLPDSLGTYQFNYNKFSELTRIKYPTGGETRYGYTGEIFKKYDGDPGEPLQMTFVCIYSGEDLNAKADSRQVLRRAATTNPGSSGTYDVTKYTPVAVVDADRSSRCGSNPVNNTQMEVRDAAGNKSVYTFTDSAITGRAGLEVNAKVYQGESVLLQEVSKAYVSSGFYSESLPSEVITTLYGTSAAGATQNRKITYNYDTFTEFGRTYSSYGGYTAFIDNPTEVSEYDADQTTLLRKTTTGWLKTNPVNSKNYFGSDVDAGYYIHIWDLKSQEKVYDPRKATEDQLQTWTTYEYDQYTYAGFSSGKVSSGATQHENRNWSGDLTKVTRLKNSGGTWTDYASTLNQYDDAGNILATKDPGGHTATFDFTDNWGNTACLPTNGFAKAYVKVATNAAGHTTTSTYNSCTGTVSSTKDPNQQQTYFTYDANDRLWKVNLPLGATVDLEKTYDDAARIMTTSKLRDESSHYIVNRLGYDGLGRKILEELCLTEGCTSTQKTRTTYNSVGLVDCVTNPYVMEGEPTSGQTCYDYDGLGRVTQVTPPDGDRANHVNVVKTEYSGNGATTTDQAGKQRRTYTDPLGRLIQVHEPGVAQ